MHLRLLQRLKTSDVHAVMVNGRIVVEDGKLVTIDEEDPAARLAEAASRQRTEKEERIGHSLEELKRYVIRYYEGGTQQLKFDPYFVINSRGFAAASSLLQILSPYCVPGSSPHGPR